ncbi:S-adenosyl-L-methionine-dependent methyltransferase [Rhodocollybia butyracea]|uniref:S-adenosyl-L-methionine-dependent methyltransferase n=1 Tax=Rhodocollybia butyracea TaxID=206335 RepID=A0A9P5PH70_9AGAR|nr:S-adenosyl-L-methionine-dependent methyltransferase [Rhodocollybia butyracea]
MASSLTTLAEIISAGIRDIESTYHNAGITPPSLDEPSHPASPAPPTPLDNNPSLDQQKRLVIAAAAQLIASIQTPVDVLKESVGSLYTAATLGFVIDIKLADVLNASGSKGLHVDEIAAITNVDASHLARVLRYLATRHIFRELSPDVFTNNRISALLASYQPLEVVNKNKLARFDAAPSAAHTSHYADEGLKIATFFSSYLQTHKTHTEYPNEYPNEYPLPFNQAFNTPDNFYEWYEHPQNEWRARRFAAAMNGNGKRFAGDIISDGINITSLNPGDVVVDVGGGVGSATLALYKQNPHLRYVVQDLDAQISAAKKFWDEHCPDAIRDQSVRLQVHSFFDPQPIPSAAIYFLRIVTHNWPDTDVRNIMSQLKAGAGRASKLVIFDVLAHHTCRSPSLSWDQPHASSSSSVPYPLLGNLGIAGAGIDTIVDMHMLALFNGKERTEADFKKLGEETGWKLESVRPGCWLRWFIRVLEHLIELWCYFVYLTGLCL